VSDARIHAYLRADVTGQLRQRVGPFLLRVAPHTIHPMSNFAIPDDGAQPTSDEVAAMADAFTRRGLMPRLEFAHGAAPELEAILVSAGFAVDGHLPILGCRPDDRVRAATPPGITVGVVATEQDQIDALVVANEAYGEPPGEPTTDDVAARLRMCAAGGVVALARDARNGAPAGSGLFTAPRAGASELAAIGTGTAFRGRGVAAAVTSLLVRRASDAGVELLWLTPDHAQAERIYTRVGFARLGGHMVHISKPGP
jgi:GNAT superfamily N-acetyltransferase